MNRPHETTRLIAWMMLILLCGCSGEEKSSQGISTSNEGVHPAPERIPHLGEATVVESETRNGNLGSGALGQLVNAAGRMDEGEVLDTTSTGIFVSGSAETRIARLDEGRILVLDTESGKWRLTEYDTRAGRARIVAEKGQGPGNVTWATGLDVAGDTAYVSAQDMRIVAYDCSGRCTYGRTIHTGYSPLSVAHAGDHFYTLGQIPLSAKMREIDSLQGPVQQINSKGSILHAFGEGYETDAWMVKNRLGQGDVDYTNDPARIAVAYSALPTIYVYQNDGQLSETYRIRDFKTVRHEYSLSERSISINQADNYSTNANLTATDSGRFILTVRSRRKDGGEERSRYDYYLLDEPSGEAFHVAGYAYNDAIGKEIKPTSGRPVLVSRGEVFVFDG